MFGIHQPARIFSIITLIAVFALFSVTPIHAAKLSDLVRKNPQLFLPSQIIPGKTAVFTVKGKPGQQIRLILSSTSKGTDLPNGLSLRVGRPTVEQTGVIPASGVLEMRIDTPEDYEALGEKQFVEAIVWSNPDQSDVKAADVIEHSGLVTDKNVVYVGEEAEAGSMMLVPGDMGMSNMLRSLGTLNDVKDDPRKRNLIDNGDINRKRLIDQTLNNKPN